MNKFIYCIKESWRIRGPIGFIVFIVYRFGNLIYYKVNFPVMRQALYFIYRILDILVVRIIGKAEIPAQTRIGKYVGFVHGANGVVIGPSVVIGDRVTIHHQVTIGQLNSAKTPVIGNNVYIGVGAKILGDINIGEGAKIGANAVVTKDVPSYATAVGVPARIIIKGETSSQ